MGKKKSLIKKARFSEGERCYYPYRLDSYNKGCKHNCLYCYSRASNSRFPNQWNIENISHLEVSEIKKLFNDAFETDKKNKEVEVLRKRIPLRLGGVTDLFQPIEKHKRITYNLIKILNEYNYPYLIVTKSALVGEEEYLNILNKELAYVQLTITTLNENLARIIEPNASSILSRLDCLDKLINRGIYTGVRISPIIPCYCDGYYTNYKLDRNKFDYFSFELVHNICQRKPNTIICEFLRISPMIKKILIENNMKQIVDLFNNNIKGKDGSLHFSKEEKEYYFKQIIKICKKYNVEHSICDDLHYEYFRKYWSNKNDCCNGLNRVLGFKTTFKDTINS